MKLQVGENSAIEAKAGTWGGIMFTFYLKGAANDYSILPADLLTKYVTVDVKLTRAGNTTQIFNNNLLLLGTYFMRKNNYSAFNDGIVLVPDAAGTKMEMLRACQLKLRSPLWLRDGDVLNVQVQFAPNAVTANIDPNASWLDVILTPTIGHEAGIPQTRFTVVPVNSDSYDFVNSNGVKHVEFMNFNYSDLVNLVLTNVSLSSDKLNYNTTAWESIIADYLKYPNNIPYQYGATQLAPTVVRTLNQLPQNLTVYEAGPGKECLNNARVTLNFNSANVAASQNWVGWDTIYIDPRNARAVANQIAKHARENIAKVSTGTMS